MSFAPFGMQMPQQPTQQGVDRRRQIAEALMKVGQQGTGLSGPWGGVASLLSGGIAGWQQKKAGQEQMGVDKESSRRIAEALVANGADPGAVKLLETMPLEQQRAAANQMVLGKIQPKASEGFTLSRGQARYDASGKPIATYNDKADRVDLGDSIGIVDDSGNVVQKIPKGASPDTRLNVDTTRRGQDITRDTATRGQDIGSETTRRGQDISASTAIANQQATAGRTANRDVVGLRKEFRSLPSVRDYESSLPIIESAKKAPDTPAGDLQVIYSVGKVLDPNSVVREGELQLTQDATPFLQKIAGKARAEIAGSGRLTPQTRANLVAMLEERVKGYQQAYSRDYDSYSQYSRDIGAEPGQIVGSRPESAYSSGGSPPVSTPPATQLAANGGPPESPRIEAPPAAIEALKANPALAPQFQAKFGYLPPGM